MSCTIGSTAPLTHLLFLEGDDLVVSYLSQQITLHKAVIFATKKLLKTTKLRPSAIKQQVEGALPVLSKHLYLAEELLSQLRISSRVLKHVFKKNEKLIQDWLCLADKLRSIETGYDWMLRIIDGNNYEIQSSLLILERTEDPNVVNYAQLLIDDHSQQSRTLIDIINNRQY